MIAPDAPDAAAAPDPTGGSDPRSALSLLRDLQAGSLVPSALGAADRRRLVEHLWAEGYGAAETAEILKVSERTVLRDRAMIREANALRPSEGFVAETVGALVRSAEGSVARLRRLARDRDTPPASKVEAERAAWGVQRELAHTLQRLGYLPTAPQQLQAQLHHSFGEPPDYEDLSAEAARLRELVDADAAPELRTGLEAVLDECRRGALAQRVQRLCPVLPAPAAEGSGDGPA